MGDALSANHYPCAGQRLSPVPLVLLHGWGNDARVWDGVLPLLRSQLDVVTVDLPGYGQSPPCRDWQQVIHLLAAVLPERCLLMGWSLGGMLAVQFAHRYPARVAKLVTLAANASFVVRPGWRAATPQGVFDDFLRGFAAQPVRTLKQFTALEAKGDREEKSLLRWLRSHGPETPGAHWLAGLHWLGELDNREALAGLAMPSLHLFGSCDQLVPASAADAVAALAPGARVQLMEGAGHASHISRPANVAQLVLEHLSGAEKSQGVANPYQILKRQIADSFGRAAASYDQVAELQRQVGGELLNLMPAPAGIEQVADMGCGTGFFTPRLAARFPGARSTGLDLSPGMVAFAADHHRDDRRLGWLCGDAEALAIETGSFDLVFANFSFQWCQDLQGLMAEQWRVLRPGGHLLFTTVGPRTLWQLREAWRAVDDYVHVNQFCELATLKSVLDGPGFETLHWRETILTRHYRQLSQLTGELKALGAHNLNLGRNRALTGRKQVLAFKAAYERFRVPEGLPADWQVVYVVARKPIPGEAP